jgi:hypothetical protein
VIPESVDPATAASKSVQSEKPFAWTVVFQMLIATCSVLIAAAAIVFTISNILLARNSQLVQIGVEVLRVDPRKETQVAAAREWALDVIDANSGVKFSQDARSQLLDRPLDSRNFLIAPLPLTPPR